VTCTLPERFLRGGWPCAPRNASRRTPCPAAAAGAARGCVLASGSSGTSEGNPDSRASGEPLEQYGADGQPTMVDVAAHRRGKTIVVTWGLLRVVLEPRTFRVLRRGQGSAGTASDNYASRSVPRAATWMSPRLPARCATRSWRATRAGSGQSASPPTSDATAPSRPCRHAGQADRRRRTPGSAMRCADLPRSAR
jgi:hypothetical protein